MVDFICESANAIMVGFLWRADFHAVAELFPITAFLILLYKAFRKPTLNMRLKDFRLEIALLLPWAVTQGVRAIWVFSCWVE